MRRCHRLARLAVVLLLSAPAAPTAGEAPNRTAPEVTPPRLLALEGIEVPPEVAVPAEGRVVVVRVLVTPEGTAQVEACNAESALCSRVAEAMARAQFAPATRDGEPIPARVQVALQIAVAPTAEPSNTQAAQANQPIPEQADRDAPATGATPSYGATARVAEAQPGMRRLELAEVRDMPGAFGDPFRAVTALPGVVPIISGLPYVFVRGAPPAGTLYIYDGIPLPTLYHLALGPAVIHPRMVGPVRLYSGVAPARYGRLTGGVVVGEGPEPPDGQTHAEAELRLLDVSGWLQTDGLGGQVTAAVRYGYPALLLSIFSPEVSLAYWDYQLRYTTRLSARDRLELVALGSYDSFGQVDDAEDDITIAFHRLEPRFIRRVGDSEYGAALLLGYEESTLGEEFSVSAARLTPRMWLRTRFDEHTTLRLSADLVAVAGSFSGFAADVDDSRARESLFGDVPARSMWGLQAELGIRPLSKLELQLGARADAWLQGAGAEGVLDPSARVIWHLRPDLDLHVAGGVVHQPAVFYLPLPGIVDVATSQGLQAAIQSEAGIGWDLPLSLRVEVQGFMHLYQDLVFVDALALESSFDEICAAIECGDAQLEDRLDGVSYGVEMFLRRAITEDLSGWLSYTLAWSSVDDVAGIPYTPTWDVRHLGNLIIQWRIGGGLSAGARLHARSGKLIGEFLIDDNLRLGRDERRLPWFVRLDAQLAYAWQPSWGRMRVSLEWFNATLSAEPVGSVCAGSPRRCQVEYLPAIFFPNLGVRGAM